MNISIQVDDRVVREAFRKAPAKTISTMRNWVGRTAALTERTEKQEVPVDKGLLQNSIHIMQSGLRAEVKPTVKYALWVHEGTGIYARNGNGRKTPWFAPVSGLGGGAVFGFWTRGQKPNPYADRTYKIVKPQAERSADAALSELARSI